MRYVVAALSVVLLAACSGGGDEPAAQVRPWGKPAEVRGSAVTVQFTGSACQKSRDYRAEETSEQVVLTVRETTGGGSCVAMAVTYTVVAELEAPLGDRALVDGACLLEKYADDPDVCGADAS
ncbi:hypothetical protein H5V45_21165 [Nocardioides sp. KIGAM211]|uniref:Lipoprotein n=1 Tax=Nocardioides luti TaxID=2761101 RepID=A0A7X0RK81_9ACTN|nr:hypothetical protein [Nocardioides luti]MBB6629842.1 hypothetical protein [Nocardioides luti]